MSSATAVAHPNLAIVKYWGKRDERLVLPHQSSVSLTLAPLEVKTSVELGVVSTSEVMLHGRRATGKEAARVLALVARVTAEPVRVSSEANFPMAAGLASSAAGFAALAVAVRAAAGLGADVAAASRLARLGSGSACRSIQGGFCVWRKGVRPDGEDSVAEQIAPASAWPEVRMIAAVVSSEEKAVSSRDGMRSTVETSPFYPAWVGSAEAEVAVAEAAIRSRDLSALGEIAERSAWRMHASALGASPPLCYLMPETLRIIQAVASARETGIPVWFTLDAGPNPVLITDAAHSDLVEALAREHGAKDVTCCVPGGDSRLVA